jgi:dienelactone hydrolase
MAALSPFDPEGAFAGVDAYRFEVVSRGDFVPGVLYLPPRGRASDKGASDLPLHGARSSPKLSARLIEGVDHVVHDQSLDPETHALVEEFARQSTSDLVRTLDAISMLDAIDEGRIGYVGFSLGAVVGTYLLAHDPRARVAVLALAGGARGPRELDPAMYIGRGEVRPLLVVAAEDDKRVSVASSRALFDAARDPKEFLLSPGDHGQLSGKTLGRIQTFLKDEFVR